MCLVCVRLSSPLQDKKNMLTLNNARMKKELQEIENKILFLLSNSKGNILDDENLIETLAQVCVCVAPSCLRPSLLSLFLRFSPSPPLRRSVSR